MTNLFNHVMIDIEAMGKNKKAPVMSIGAVFFEPLTKEIGPKFYQRVSLESAMKYGAEPDASTILFWMEQSEEARKELAEPSVSLPVALEEFTQFLNTHRAGLFRNLRVWSNGPAYDAVILEHAFRSVDFDVPWVYFKCLDVRTVVEMGRWIGIDPKRTMPFTGTPHKASDDAEHQVRYICEIFSSLFLTDLATRSLQIETAIQIKRFNDHYGREE